MDNNKLCAFTLDLESEYAGILNQYAIFDKHSEIEKILSLLDSFGVKITVFVVGEIFKLHPEVIRILEKYNCEFEIHSHSHGRSNVDMAYEIESAKNAYHDYFKKHPKGYRAPCGEITPEIIKLLEKNGFLYDSSIFPSYYPNPLRYFFCNRNVYHIKDSSILEIPFTSITPLRLTLSLSYLKLLGFNVYLNLFRIFGLPNFICFNIHLHDFIVSESSYQKLSPFWKFVYGRNKFKGTDYCIKFIKHIKQKGYRFCFMLEVCEIFKSNDGRL